MYENAPEFIYAQLAQADTSEFQENLRDPTRWVMK